MLFLASCLLTGALAVAFGLAVVFNPVSTLDTVSALLAAYLVVDGGAALLFSSRLGEAIVLGVSMWVGGPLSGLRALGVQASTAVPSGGPLIASARDGE
jgi:hypothetical protein